jgi:predicted amidohydrolase
VQKINAMTATIRIGLIQMRCEKAAIDENLATLSRHLHDAAGHGIDIVGFPEMSLTGYADPTRFPQAVVALDGPEVKRLLDATRAFAGTVLAGLIEANPSGKPFITHIAARQGRMLGCYRKITIKDEEVEWFSAGDRVPGFRHDSLTFGIAICADIENEPVFAECRRRGAQVVFELAAPGLYGEQSTRDWKAGYDWWEGHCREHLSRYAREHNLWIPVATQAGRTLDEDFPGGGFVFAPGGERVFPAESAGGAAPDWQPGAVYLQLDLETGRVEEL